MAGDAATATTNSAIPVVSWRNMAGNRTARPEGCQRGRFSLEQRDERGVKAVVAQTVQRLDVEAADADVEADDTVDVRRPL